ncbi:MAG: hypothetical protein PHE83_19075 [Opitutaceae bacterium]|nr:hypothetical protein [Opitutaceae bacterium]
MPSPFLASARDLVARLVHRRQAPAPAPVAAVEQALTEASAPPHALAGARNQAEVAVLLRVTQVAILANVLLAGIFAVGYQVARSRPLQQITSAGDLREQIRRHVDIQGVRKDDIVSFLYLVLTLKHEVSPAGAPFLPLLQGLVSADIFRDAQAEILRNLTTIQSRSMVQSLVIEQITDLDFDQATRRVGATIVGKIELRAASTQRGVPLVQSVEYRARAILDVLPPSEINRHGYFLLSPLREVFGRKNVAAFDQEMEERRGKLSGR